MRKPPIPTFVAAYPKPAKDNFNFVLLLLIAAAIIVFIYKRGKNENR